jgi:hypothetical protein
MSDTSPPGPHEVIVTDVRMPFWSMVAFMIKWAFASIPAFIILMFVALLFVGLLAVVFGVGRSVFSPTPYSFVPKPTPTPFVPMPTPVPRSYR